MTRLGAVLCFALLAFPAPAPAGQDDQPPFYFVDRTEEAGLSSFRHVLGTKTKDYIMDAMGSGVCIADVDNDGFDDVYFLNGDSYDRAENMPAPKNHLFRNNGDGTFTDITEQSGTGDTGWGMSACFGDIDNDGDIDLYVGNYGRNVLYRNRGGGVFEDVTKMAGVEDGGFTVGTVFADVDRDGWLDLFVANYVNASREIIHSLGLHGRYHGLKVLLGPLSFDAQPDLLYHNNGDGTFTNIASKVGLNPVNARAMGCIFSDLDNDGDLDLYVANDRQYNFVYENLGNGTFQEIGILSGASVDQDGVEHGSMGVSVSDFNMDGLPDIFVTSYHDESDMLFQNLGSLFFKDVSRQFNLVEVSRATVTWGTAFGDFDNDGFDDIVTANGHVYANIELLKIGSTYADRNTILHNIGGKRFVNESSRSGPGFQVKKVSRGLALSDFDRDGDVDIFINNLDDTPTLLVNESRPSNWLEVLVDVPGGSPIGSRVTVQAGEINLSKEIHGGGGYESQDSSVLHFGLGKNTSATVTVRFPLGNTKILENVTANQILRVQP